MAKYKVLDYKGKELRQGDYVLSNQEIKEISSIEASPDIFNNTLLGLKDRFSVLVSFTYKDSGWQGYFAHAVSKKCCIVLNNDIKKVSKEQALLEMI